MRSNVTRTVERLLGRHPYLFAFWLGLRNRVLRRVDRRRNVAAAVAVVVIGVVVAMAVGLLAPPIHDWLAYLDAHSSWLMVLAVLQAATSFARRRSRMSAALRDSWLASAPRSVQTRRLSLILAVMWGPIAQLGLLVLCLLLTRFIEPSDAAVVERLMLVIVGSYASGVFLGAVFSRGQRHGDQPGSRYIPGNKSNLSIGSTASLSALARWPIASAFAWATPNTVRWPLMAAMLSVMSGTPALAGVLVVSFWMLIVYMFTLLTSTLRVARQAAEWLRCTPISFGRFAIAIGGRSLLHQLVAAALITALFAIDTRSPWQSILFVTPWVALVLIAYATTITYAFNARRGARISIALSAISIAVFESVYRGAAVPMALLVCAWQLRLGVLGSRERRISYVT